MRWRRPLAASAAVALAALAMLALTTRPGQTAVVTTEIPVSVTADCGALGEAMTIHLSAKTLSPGYNQVVVTQKNVSRETIASVLVADDGTLDADVTMPARKNNGIYVIYLNGNSSLREGDRVLQRALPDDRGHADLRPGRRRQRRALRADDHRHGVRASPHGAGRSADAVQLPGGRGVPSRAHRGRREARSRAVPCPLRTTARSMP